MPARAKVPARALSPARRRPPRSRKAVARCQWSAVRIEFVLTADHWHLATAFLLLGGLLLAGDSALAGTFARAGIRMRPLAAHRQPAAMAHAAVAIDLHQAL